MTKTKTLIFSLRSLTLLIFVSIFAQLIIPSTVAHAADLKKVEETAYSWQAYQYYLDCSTNNIKTNMSQSEVTSYNWFNGNNGPDAGFVLGGDDAKAACTKDDERWLSKALGYWGFTGDAAGFLKAIGFQVDGDRYKFTGKLNGGTGTECGNAEECFKLVIGTKYYGLSPTEAKKGIALSSKDAYYLAFQNFTIGCSATQQKLWSEATPDEKLQAKGNDGKTYQVKLVNPQSGAVEEWLFTSDKARGDDIIVGPALANGNISDREMTCGALVNKINENINGYATYVKAATAAGLTVAITNDPATNTKDDPNASCEAEIEFGWAICPIARTADKFASWVQGIIVSLLRINDTPEAYSGIKTGWSQMRMISSILIVLVALVMIGSQIFGFEFMSAYTIKKVLPKLVIAAILIQLSWFIFTTMISIVNAVGDGVAAILLSPFPDLAAAAFADPPTTLQFILTTFGENAANGWTFGGGAMLLAGGALVGFGAIGGLAGLGLAAIGVVLACLVAFVTLVLRKVLILALLLIAPLALVAWILPGTQKWWEKWWDMFSKLLFMYPLVIGLITVGQIGAYLAAQTGSFVAPGTLPNLFADAASESSTMVVFFIILICYFGPFFFIPSMFKLGGTVLAKAAGFAKTGADTFKKGRPYRNLEKARDNNKQQRDYDSKARGQKWAQGGGLVGRVPGVGKKLGQFQSGRAGVNNPLFGESAFAKQFAEQEEQENLKNAHAEYTTAAKGMEFKQQVDESVGIATAKTGDKVKINGKEVVATEAMQRTAAKFLADTGRADALRTVEQRLGARGHAGQELWNTIKNENAGSITKINPDQMGKAFDTLSAVEISDMKPESVRNMRAMMADPGVSAPRKARIAEQIETLMDPNNSALLAKLGPDGQRDIREMHGQIHSAGGAVTMRGTTEIVHEATGRRQPTIADHLGRTEYIFDAAGTAIQNPDYEPIHEIRDDNGTVVQTRRGW